MELIVNNTIINEPIDNIIHVLKSEADWNVFSEIQVKENYLRVTCPFHKDGKEAHPSCSIYTDYDSKTVMPGTYHCFTCGEVGQLYQLVAKVLGITEEEGKKWLSDKFGEFIDENDRIILSLDLEEKPKPNFLDESILDKYKYYHPYAQQRKISFEIAKRFSVGWNEEKNTLTFPVWDEYNRLVMITERSINSKQFYIPSGVEKPVYLLNFALTNHYTSVIVCEGQIDALVAYSYGYPAVALFGSGTTDYQLNILKNCGIRDFVLMYDNDLAGRKGAERFKKAMHDKAFITDIIMPQGRDIADLSKEEFQYILKMSNIPLDINCV